MNYLWSDKYLTDKKHVVKDYKEEWSAYRYMVADKMFAMRGADKYGKPIFTLKLPPDFCFELRELYNDVVPGYYMNKTHWVSVYLDGAVPDYIFKNILDVSYNTILKALPKKVLKMLEEDEL